MTTTVLVVANALLAASVVAACTLLGRTTSSSVTVFTVVCGSIYAANAFLLPSRKVVVRWLASLQLGAGLAMVGVSWFVIPTVWVVHGSVPSRVLGGFLLSQSLLLPYLVAIPVAVLHATGTPARRLARLLGGAGLGIALVAFGLSALVRAKFDGDLDTLVSLLGRQLSGSEAHVSTQATVPRPRAEVADDVPLTIENVDRALREATAYLVRNIGPDGRFRYVVDATTNQETHDYNWPRHGGTTWALAELGDHLADPAAREAARRAAGYLRTMLVACGNERCIAMGKGNADLGASALGLLAFHSVGMNEEATALASFLRSQARADGEMMHEYDRARGVPVDVERPYYTGETALALARTGDPRDAVVARRALAYLDRRWTFFGSRYWYDEEHWTCQAAAALRDAASLSLCRRWLAVQPRLHAGDAPFDVDGAYGLTAFAPPHITPVASRTEGALALLAVAPDAELEAWVRRSLAFLLRRQLRTVGPLVAAQARGGFPSSATELEIRIDYVQHAALALLRWRERQVMPRRESP